MHAFSLSAPDSWRVSILVRGGATRASSVLARRGADIAIFDTGMGHHASVITAALAAEGVTPSDVTLVFNTHAHPDHSHNNSVFRNADIYSSSDDRVWTTAVHEALAQSEHPSADDVSRFYPELASGSYNPRLVRKVLGIDKMLWDSSRLGAATQLKSLEDVAPPAGIRVIKTPGHAPYHLSFAIETGYRPLLVCGDALLTRDENGEAPVMPPWSISAYRLSRARLMSFDGILVPGHDAPFDNRPRRSDPADALRK